MANIYSEIFFIKKLWPDFKHSDLNNIIKKFKKLKEILDHEKFLFKNINFINFSSNNYVFNF